MGVFVSRRVAPKISRTQRFRRRLSYSVPVKFIRRSLSYFWYIFIGLILVFGLRYVLSSTIFAPTYTVAKIVYDSGSVSLYDNPFLYKTIKDAMMAKNFYFFKRFESHWVISQLKNDFPIIDTIRFYFLEDKTAAASVVFHQPDMVFYHGDNKYAVFQGQAYTLYQQNTLGADVPRVALPSYASGLDNLDGIFHAIQADVLVSQLVLMRSYFTKPKDIVYLPGAEKTLIVTADDKRIYINNLKDVRMQLKILDLLKQYYPSFAALKEIDLWSLSDMKVIVRL